VKSVWCKLLDILGVALKMNLAILGTDVICQCPVFLDIIPKNKINNLKIVSEQNIDALKAICKDLLKHRLIS
jgi:hypothetical protein